MHVRGHFIPLSDPDLNDLDLQQPAGQGHGQTQQQKYVFMATCSPLITPELKENLVQSNTMVFKTVHQLDMTFMEVTKTRVLPFLYLCKVHSEHLGLCQPNFFMSFWIHNGPEVMLSIVTPDCGPFKPVKTTFLFFHPWGERRKLQPNPTTLMFLKRKCQNIIMLTCALPT